MTAGEWAGPEADRRPGLRIEICATQEAVAARVAGRIVAALRDEPGLILGLPTGGTALPVYRALIEAHVSGDVSFARAQLFAVDEYVGPGPEDSRSYAHFLRENLLRHVDLRPSHFHIPDGRAPDPAAEAERHAARLAAHGGYGLLFLGLGANGHLAFNEPGTPPEARAHHIRLAESTLAANARFFQTHEEQPREAITIGLADIAAAREVIVAAIGPAKARAVAAIRGGAPVGACPASILRDHPRARLVIDPEADGRGGRAGHHIIPRACL